MPNVPDKNGDTPFHIAIQHGQLSCFTYLMNQSANTNLLNNSLIAPIHQCIISNHTINIINSVSKLVKFSPIIIYFNQI